MKKKLPSGAELDVTLSTFAVSRDLYHALLEEAKGIKIDSKDEIANLCKDIACFGLSSKKIDICIWECMKRVTYNGLRVTEDTFEPELSRQDYVPACIEVVEQNVGPFTKSLYALYCHILEKLQSAHV